MLLTALALTAATLARAQDPPERVKVARRKALFVEQFTRLVGWPAASLPPEGPFILCLQGTGATADELEKLATVRRFKERTCQVRRPRPASPELGACHVLYLGPSEGGRLAQTLAAVSGRPVLTVSDTPGFVERGVHFNLFEETRSAPQPGTYVAFELNVAAIKRSVLSFAPGLLTAGRRVDGAPARGSPP